MNQRIRQLADEAAEFIEAGPGSWTSDIFEQKFAELIVRECAEVAFKTDVSYTETDAMHRIRDRIKQHFGVEE